MKMAMWRFLAPAGVIVPVLAYGCGEFDVDSAQPAAGDDAGGNHMMPPTGDADAGMPADLDASGGALGDVGPVGPSLMGLHIVGNQILNAQNDPVIVHGVNRSGTEYKCVQRNGSVFDGLSDETSIQAIASWKANAVRIPLNESCWLGINGSPAATSGANYQSAILAYVALLHKYNIVPIVELHWVGPNNTLATAQQPMPDGDSVTLWQSVAQTFASDDGVIFEPYNEPFPGSNRDTAAAWSCWQGGCAGVAQAGLPRDAGAATYTAVGMQQLVDAIRGAENPGAPHVVLLGGIEYSNDLSAWLANKPNDATNNLGAAWHIYSNNACATAACWQGDPATIAQSFPIVATEIGERDCQSAFINPLMTWLDQTKLGYLAWSWDAYGACVPQPPPEGGAGGSPWSLVTDYVSGTPNGAYAQAFHDHIVLFASP
jgi:hypothetical protein